MANLNKRGNSAKSSEKRVSIASDARDEPMSSARAAVRRQTETLIEETNNTFRELSTTLNNEQTKIMELEERRKKLLNEMMDLKADIEKEKEICRLDLEATGSDHELDNESIDSSHGLTPEEIEKKKKLKQKQQERNSIQITEINDSNENKNNAGKRKSSTEIAIDIKKRLEDIAKRSDTV